MPPQGDKPITNCEDVLSPGKESATPHKAHSYAADLGPKDCTWENAFPNKKKRSSS